MLKHLVLFCTVHGCFLTFKLEIFVKRLNSEPKLRIDTRKYTTLALEDV